MTKLLTLQEQLLLAIKVATRAHAGQKRKDGTDYIAHPLNVAFRAVMQGEDLIVQIACILHDVVEDTDETLDSLRDYGFDAEVIETVDAVTKRKGEKYLTDFIPRVKKSEYGIIVKNLDIDHNIEDQSALEAEEAGFLRSRYTSAKEILNGKD